ncbi:DNA topoisomerase III [Bacillus sp. FJAT-47783]|uniref:DNA topoisomerase III n=1 Tax=Bacillus sp. FJAT-47783 TaxID=2922712 RepID=UPI001FAD0468|nr:DNA topoisomerase III [Bacillus sp. FJAT-47783]
MGCVLIIAEKPDQGAKLAAPFPHRKKQGYIEINECSHFPNGAIMTWAIGHLCELVPPEEYDSKWKRWKLETLPILPTTFQHRVSKGKWKQFQIIREFVQKREINEIIIASDAGREGEAIVRLILQLCRPRQPLKRLWISSLTESAVRKGFEQLLDEKETRNLFYEAYSRSCADWLVGMNASRVYSLLLKEKGISSLFSIGRVQTPTLSLIVKREKEIESFVSKPFWEVIATFQMNGKIYEGKWHKNGETRLDDGELAQKIARFCQEKEAEITEIKKERKHFQPPYLYNLSSLQAEANKRFKFSPKKTLDIAQKLYIKGNISYPRSDSSFVTKEEANMFPQIVAKFNKMKEYESFFPLPNDSLLNNKRYVNEKKVTDHYAIIPTEQVVNVTSLPPDEQKIYDLIVKRLIAAHYNEAIVDYTTVHTVVDGRAQFISKGTQMIEKGWRTVLSQEKKKEEKHLPPLSKGERGEVKHVKVKEGKTEPPKRYTEGQLITLMKTAGKWSEDEELSKVLQETEGLGTEATRAQIITVLKDRKYIEVKKNQVYATEKGKLLISSICSDLLTSPDMTAKWEQRLREIGKGEASAKQFIEQTKKLVVKMIDDAKRGSEKWNFESFDIDSLQENRFSKSKKQTATKLGTCPTCGGVIVDKGNFYGCSNYTKTNCTMTISKTILSKKISQANVKKLLKDGETNVIKGFKKGEKTFDAKLKLHNGKISFAFPQAKQG